MRNHQLPRPVLCLPYHTQCAAAKIIQIVANGAPLRVREGQPPVMSTHEVDGAQKDTDARTTHAHFDVPGVNLVRDSALQQISSKMVQLARRGACASVGCRHFLEGGRRGGK